MTGCVCSKKLITSFGNVIGLHRKRGGLGRGGRGEQLYLGPLVRLQVVCRRSLNKEELYNHVLLYTCANRFRLRLLVTVQE